MHPRMCHGAMATAGAFSGPGPFMTVSQGDANAQDVKQCCRACLKWVGAENPEDVVVHAGSS